MQLWLEEAVKLICGHLLNNPFIQTEDDGHNELYNLETYDVCTVIEQLLHDILLPVIPEQSPGRTVAIELSCSILLT
jgi:hypothetical protein